MDDESERGRRVLADAHPRDRDPDAPRECAHILIGREKDRQQIPEQRRLALMAGEWTYQIMGPAPRT